MVLDRSPRVCTQSRQVLEEQVNHLQDSLEVTLADASNVHSLDTVHIPSYVKRLKSLALEFGEASSKLGEWLTTRGHTEEASNVRRQRHLLVYREVRETMHSLNALLSDLHLDTVSTIGPGSVASGHVGHCITAHQGPIYEEPLVDVGEPSTDLHNFDAGASKELTGKDSTAKNTVPRTNCPFQTVPPHFSKDNRGLATEDLLQPPSVRPKTRLGVLNDNDKEYNNPQTNSRWSEDIPRSARQVRDYSAPHYAAEAEGLNNVRADGKINQNFMASGFASHNQKHQKRNQFSSMGHKPLYEFNQNLSNQRPCDQHKPRLDFHIQHNLKQDLLKGMPCKFNGEPQHFLAWKDDILKRIDECGAESRDAINILEANTSGRPQEMVRRFKAAYSSNPDASLADILVNFERRFATSERIAEALKIQISNFRNMKDTDIHKLEEYLDLCKIIQNNMPNCSELYIFNLKEGMKSVWSKLPLSFQNKWRSRFVRHEALTGSAPDFGIFIEFFEDQLLIVSHPQFSLNNMPTPRVNAKALTTNTSHTSDEVSDTRPTCSYHKVKGHTLTECKVFGKLPFVDRKQYAYDNKLCFACLEPHFSSKCLNRTQLSCGKCQLPHITIMHNDKVQSRKNSYKEKTPDDFRPRYSESNDTTPRNACMRLCGSSQVSKVCSKTLPVEIKVQGGDQVFKCLCIIDEQSNTSFCDPYLVDFFNLSAKSIDYSLTNMHGKMTVSGSIVPRLAIRGIDCTNWYNLPDLLTHRNLPNTIEEAATPEIVSKHSHIRHLAPKFPLIDPELQVMVLVGADAGDLMQSMSVGSHHPFVHITPLGYSLVGSPCIDDGTGGAGCAKNLRMSTETPDCSDRHLTSTFLFPPSSDIKCPSDPFLARPDDNLQGWSQEDIQFTQLMESEVIVNEKGNLQLPLPLKQDIVLPDNKAPVYHRTKNTLERLERCPDKLSSALEVFEDYRKAGHVEQLGGSGHPNKETYYVPIFPVYDTLKNKTRLVFDSSATFGGSSLNQALLQGPDTNNGLFGVLLRFRLKEVAIVADIEKMFHSFYVDPRHTDRLRFFWFRDNNPSQGIAEYRALVHIFGNKPSPAIANFALRYTTLALDANKDSEVSSFIRNHFYVDDALYSAGSVEEAIDTLSEAKKLLGKFNIRLHKLRSSHQGVLDAFPKSELANTDDSKPILDKVEQKTLGISWNHNDDTLKISPNIQNTPFTKRGILAVVNAVYDPHGFVSPVVLSGKLLQRKVLPPKGKDNYKVNSFGWDDELPDDLIYEWNRWKHSLKDLELISIPRCITPVNFGGAVRTEIHGFSDASIEAIGYVIFIRLVNSLEEVSVSILHASSKVAPQAANTIPRLELCGALDLSRAVIKVAKELQIPISSFHLYTDSKIVLGYLTNTSKRFSRYISYRVDEILLYTSVEWWNYIPGQDNIGDTASRPHTVQSLLKTEWLQGPAFLHDPVTKMYCLEDVEDTTLPETKCLRIETQTPIRENVLTSSICRKETNWLKACRVTALVIKFIHLLQKCEAKKSCPICSVKITHASKYLIREAQKSVFYEDLISLSTKGETVQNSKIAALHPNLDSDKIMHVGGRLHHSNFPGDVKYPILLPEKHKVTEMIIQYHHSLVRHQGRHITSGAIRQAGFHVVKGSTVVKKLINACIICRRIRGPFRHQRMADLPAKRLEETPPFTHAGLDLFGPYLVHDGISTRRTKATKKVWCLLITCLVSRAIHLEVLPYLDTNSLQLGLRRFYSVRGTCRSITSDRGSNIVGAKNQLIDFTKVKSDAENHGVSWNLIPPGASSWGGVWERKVGAIKRILDATLLLCGKRDLSRDEFSTFIQESASVVNNTPLWDTSSSPDDPAPLSPANLLTLRDEPNPPQVEDLTPADILQYGKLRWRRVVFLSEQFWLRWRQQYLHSLQQRTKWHTKNVKIMVGDIVLVKGPSKRNHWPVGRIIETMNGRDGLIRSVKVRLTSGGSPRILERQIRDTVLLVANTGE